MQAHKFLSCSMLLFVAACSSNDNDTSPQETMGTEDQPGMLDPSFNISDTAFDLSYDLAGYKLDQLAGVVPDLANIVTQTAIGSPEVLDSGEFNTTDVRFGDVITETDRTRYQCSSGGSLIHETGTLQLNDTSYSHIRNINNYAFDQCLFEITSDRVAAGNYRATGVLNISQSTRAGSGFSEGAGGAEWTAFDLTGPESLRYEVEGSSSWETVASAGNSSDSRLANFNYYRKTQDVAVIEAMAGSSFEMAISYHPANLVNILDLQFSGSFEDGRGAGRVITVNTDSPLSFSAGTDEAQLTQEGQISLQSSDGGSMTLNAIGTDDRLDPSKSPLVDWSSISSDGSTDAGTRVSLGSYSAAIDLCDLASSDEPLVCVDGNFAYLLP